MAQDTTLIEAYSCNIQVTDTLHMQKDPKAMSLKDWIVAQSQDSVMREIQYHISKNIVKGHKVYLQDTEIIQQYLRQHSHLVLCKGVIYRWVTPSKKTMNPLQLIIPQDYQKKALQGCHDDIRHMGLQQILNLLLEWFYWPRMTKDVELHIARYDHASILRVGPQKVVMENIYATHPLQ